MFRGGFGVAEFVFEGPRAPKSILGGRAGGRPPPPPRTRPMTTRGLHYITLNPPIDPPPPTHPTPKIPFWGSRTHKNEFSDPKTPPNKFSSSWKKFFFLEKCHVPSFFLLKTIKFDVLRPWEYVRTLPRASGVVFGTNLIKFHGLRPEL